MIDQYHITLEAQRHPSAIRLYVTKTIYTYNVVVKYLNSCVCELANFSRIEDLPMLVLEGLVES